MNIRKTVTIFVTGAILVTLIAALAAFPLGRGAYKDLKQARVSIIHAESLIIKERDYALAAREFRVASELFGKAEQKLRALRYLQVVPWVSRNLKALRSASASGSVSSRAIASVLEVAAQVSPHLDIGGGRAIGDIPVRQREALMQTIAQSIPKLQGAKAELMLSRTLLSSVPRRGVSGKVVGELDAFDDRVQKVIRILDDGIPFLEVAPQLLGYPSAKQYLLLLQNSDEMRPTGGFIGTYGLIKIEAGHITDFSTDDVYNLDRFSPPARRPLAPKPLAQYLEQSRWYLRDANWSPDFPTSARQVLQFYKEEAHHLCQQRKGQSIIPNSCFIIPDTIDGVIALMPEAIIPLLKVVGPITVSGQKFTAKNFTDALEYEVEIKFDEKGIPRTQRKEIVSQLGHILIEKLLALPTSSWPQILHSIATSLQEKHILVAATDPGVQALLAAHNWNGAIAQVPSDSTADYLGIFDANLFSLKTDPYVTRSIFYNARKEAQGLIGEVELVYSYPKSGPAWKTKGYRTWVRVYVPKGAVLITATGVMKEEGSSAPGQVEVSQEFDKTVFSAFLAVQVGEVKRMKFKYRLPESVASQVEEGSYELYVQKQPGTIGHSLTVSTDFGKVPRLWSPRGLSFSRQDTKVTWRTSLRQDQQFSLGIGN